MKTCEKRIACGLAAGFLALLFLVLHNMEIPFDPFLQSAILEFRAPMMTRAMTLLTYTANWQFITGVCLIHQGGFSFPSGHAMTGLVFYGLVLYFLLGSIKKSSTRKVLLAVGLIYIPEMPVPPDKQQQEIIGFILKSSYFKAALRPYESSALFDRIHYFLQSFKKKNPLIYTHLEENLTLFSQGVKRDMASKIDIIIFWICLVCPEISQPSKPRRALLIGDFGRLHSRFLAKSLSDFFNRETGEVLQFEIPDRPELLTPDEVAEFDLLITTTPRLQVKHPNTILIDDYPMNHNICDIHRTFFHHPDQD